eukprot:SAG31_NODE_5048_length_2778_cov_1.677118_1_plen_596_part_00
MCADDDASIASSSLNQLAIFDCALAHSAVHYSNLTCATDLADCCSITGVGDGTLQSVCPQQCGLCGPGGTWIADGFGRRALDSDFWEARLYTVGLDKSTSVGGAVATHGGQLSIESAQFHDNSAALGQTLYLEDLVDWVVRDSAIEPYDSHLSAVTLRSPLAGCDEDPCQPGFGCEYVNFSTRCTTCPLTLASTDGRMCTACQPGEGPADNGTVCRRCPSGLYSNAETNIDGTNMTTTTTICSTCAPGKRAAPEQDRCIDCPEGLHSADGLACRPCIPGQMPDAPSGATTCLQCPPGAYSSDGEICAPCAGGTEPVTPAMTKWLTDEIWMSLESYPWLLDPWTGTARAVWSDRGLSPLEEDVLFTWCSDGSNATEGPCEQGTCSYIVVPGPHPIPGCTDDDASVATAFTVTTVYTTNIVAHNCSEALQLLQSQGLDCDTDLSPAGYSMGGDGSLSWACPVICGVCPNASARVNLTYDIHNETQCRNINHSCAHTWQWPKSYGAWSYCASNGDVLSLEGRQCKPWGNNPYGVPASDTSCRPESDSTPWCYVGDAVCTEQRRSHWTPGSVFKATTKVHAYCYIEYCYIEYCYYILLY